MSSTGRLHRKVAIVTGASSGIGRAIALLFAAEGAVVVAADLTAEPVEGGEATTAAIEAAGGRADFVATDMGSSEQIESLVRSTAGAHGRLDIVVNNAATYVGKTLLDTTDDEWRRVQEVNVTGVFLLCRAAVRQMLSQPAPDGEVRGRIVNIGSQHGFVAAPRDIAYGTSKSAMMHLTRQIATDYASEGIVANNVAPGKIFTGKGGRELEPQWQAVWQSRTPWPRAGVPDDVARAALFLAEDDASFITGATLMVDGGWSAS